MISYRSKIIYSLYIFVISYTNYLICINICSQNCYQWYYFDIWITTQLEFNSKSHNQNFHVLKRVNFVNLLWDFCPILNFQGCKKE